MSRRKRRKTQTTVPLPQQQPIDKAVHLRERAIGGLAAGSELEGFVKLLLRCFL